MMVTNSGSNDIAKNLILRNVKTQKSCPHCGSSNNAKIIYGYPELSDGLSEKINKGEWVLAGTSTRSVDVNETEVSIDPTRFCNDCKKTFGTAPVFYKTDKNKRPSKGEYYRDIITDIKFSIGGFPNHLTTAFIAKTDKGALVIVRANNENEKNRYFNQSLPVMVCLKEWDRFIDILYEEIYLHEWNTDYYANVCDGVQWSLEVNMTNRRTVRYHGSNAFPPCWDEFMKLLRLLCNDREICNDKGRS